MKEIKEKFNFVRVWIKDNSLYIGESRKEAIDLRTPLGKQLIENVVLYGFSYIFDKKNMIRRYIPAHNILTVFYNEIAQEIHEDKQRELPILNTINL